MNKMPYEIKQKLRQLANNRLRGSKISRELDLLFRKHRLDSEDVDRFCAISDIAPNTEALAYIENAEGNTEDSINRIEEVFLHIIDNES